jgi:hypothetical protein
MAIEAAPARVGPSYVEWAPVFAGAIAAAAISFVLLTAGAAIGLSLVSPYPYQSYTHTAATLATAWLLIVSIGSLLVGGYLAGRLRSAWGEANSDEVEFRDGVHGFLVWALSVVAGAILGFLAATAAATGGVEVGKAAAYLDSATVLSPTVDTLVRTQTAPPATSTTPDVRPEVTRILATAVANKQLADPEGIYLTNLVAQRTGLPPAEAQKRVNEAYVNAVKAVDTARRATVLAGLATATALLIGLAAAWYAAQRGGHHRDHNIPARFFGRRRQTVPSSDAPRVGAQSNPNPTLARKK